VQAALKSLGLAAAAIEITTEDVRENMQLLRSHSIDCAFVALHGRFGEDGGIQRILDGLKIPYTGSGEAASRISMDKLASRRVFEAAGLSVPNYRIADKSGEGSKISAYTDLGMPLVVKPCSNGSSIGLSIIDRNEDFDEALSLAFSFDDTVIVEEYIKGRELTVGILDDLALAVIEIIPKKRFFDFQAKYQSGLTDYVVPAQISPQVEGQAKGIALKAHRLLGCSGCSRVDMILGEDSRIFVLEVNTIPGLTDISLLPKAAKSVGIDFAQLCLTLIELAYEKKKN